MTKFTVEIYSDTVCPFCYIGHRSLDRAIGAYKRAHPGAEFELVWRPFLIHPRFRGPTAVSRYDTKGDYFRAKYGAGADAFFARLREKGERLGIGFVWEGRPGSSWDSHKLILRALDVDRSCSLGEGEGGGRLGALLDRLFKGVFEHGEDIADRRFLAACAVEVGVVDSEEEATSVMDSEEMGRRVDWENAQGRKREIEAVPSYLVQGRYFVGGMQEPEVFEEVFARIGGKENGTAVVREGEVAT